METDNSWSGPGIPQSSISTPNVENLAFTYGTADRITKITNGMSGSYTQTLGYDALDRRTSAATGPQTAGNELHF